MTRITERDVKLDKIRAELAKRKREAAKQTQEATPKLRLVA